MTATAPLSNTRCIAATGCCRWCHAHTPGRGKGGTVFLKHHVRLVRMPLSSRQVRGIYVITGGTVKPEDKKVKGSAFDRKRFALQARIEGIDRVRARPVPA